MYIKAARRTFYVCGLSSFIYSHSTIWYDWLRHSCTVSIVCRVSSEGPLWILLIIVEFLIILLCRGVLRRIMEPNITPTVLLYNLICDIEWFCDNSDGEITTKALMNIVKSSDLRYELGLPIFTPSSLHLAMYCALPLLIRSMIVRRSICAISKRMVQMSELTGLTLSSSVRVSSLI